MHLNTTVATNQNLLLPTIIFNCKYGRQWKMHTISATQSGWSLQIINRKIVVMICILRNECNERRRQIIVIQLYASVNMQICWRLCSPCFVLGTLWQPRQPGCICAVLAFWSWDYVLNSGLMQMSFTFFIHKCGYYKIKHNSVHTITMQWLNARCQAVWC